ncbi:MAG TPA: YgjP-like metallopeptidase domain-containing protein [Phenylobacterium sp.]|jgi:predicted metal-dependent hydrolase|uniref:M48 family metallopeptidase n=1 Tax=Phenylobacterium sp. TaxID=1871053 RepID=UPI002C06BCB4|nr:YgjP-like metallopeptidase domain-containing protein [Phenylobacterium sp.]HXA41068.1 YgjP-like metallopeptidase domain-containing protein [Phenylobacterium sp.]
MSLFGRSPLVGKTWADGDRLEVAGTAVTLKVNRRARRVSLRLDRTRREIVATAPSPRRLPEAAAFARARAGWIAERIAELPDATPIHPGMTLTVFGEPVRLEAGTGRAKWLPAAGGEPARITAMVSDDFGGEGYARAVILMLKKRAAAVLGERTEVYAAMLGAPAPKVTVADAKGRWGSCRPGAHGQPASIRYSWRLALAPFAVADYVAAHECAHLMELNHGPRFWAHVKALVGEPKAHRAWLRAEGARLHAFGR